MKEIVEIYLFDLEKNDLNLIKDILDKRTNLNQIELDNIKKYKNLKEKNLHLVSLYLKNKYIGSYNYQINKKPNSMDCFFNLSHSSDVVILGKNNNYEIGVDIEKIKEIDTNIYDLILNEKEKEECKTKEDFYRIWTIKESIVKNIGIGLINNLKDIITTKNNNIIYYNNENYFIKQRLYKDYIYTICLKNSDFDLEIKEIKNGNYN